MPPLLGTPYQRVELRQIQVGTAWGSGHPGWLRPHPAQPSQCSDELCLLLFLCNSQDGLVLDVPVVEP